MAGPKANEVPAFPARVAVRIGFDEALAHLVEAGADIFLMPSIFEPCGLNQMYSLRYGTVPVVHAVGGLDDTIQPYSSRARHANGFKFRDASPATLVRVLRQATRNTNAASANGRRAFRRGSPCASASTRRWRIWWKPAPTSS